MLRDRNYPRDRASGQPRTYVDYSETASRYIDIVGGRCLASIGSTGTHMAVGARGRSACTWVDGAARRTIRDSTDWCLV